MTKPAMIGTYLRLAAFITAVFGTGSRIVYSIAGGYGGSILLYFTIQSNIMVCLFLAAHLFWRGRIPGTAVNLSPVWNNAVLLYISITGLVFNILLLPTITAGGFNLFIMTINHTITPLLFWADWMMNAERKRLNPGSFAWWLIYPIVYGVYSSIEGAITGRFRYFFLDFMSVPLSRYLVVMGIVIAAFFVVGGFILAVNNIRVLWRQDNTDPGIETL